MVKKLRIGALVSGGGSNLQAIIDACESGSINGEVVFVGSDKPGAFGLERAKKHGIPGFTIDYSSIIRGYKEDPNSLQLPDDFHYEDIFSKQSLLPPDTPEERVVSFIKTRVSAEAALLEKMENIGFDIIILAGFMRTLTPYFIDRVNRGSRLPRIMNIHPALLPSFPGIDGYGDTYNYGCKIGGCTVHFIDYGEDSGPIIGQKSFQIEPGETLDDIKAKGLKLEWELFPECIKLFSENRLKLVSTGSKNTIAVV